MKEQMKIWMDALPYPAVVMTEGKGRLLRNRLARCLLPSSSRLNGVLSEFGDEFMRELSLDGVSYLVVAFSEENERIFCFFEHFLPFQEVLSRAVVGKMQDFLWSLLNEEERPCLETSLFHEQISARVCSLRRHGDNYLRLLNTASILGKEEASTCSLNGFFHCLQTALLACGVGVSFEVREEATVYTESGVLSFLVLNLVHFARLFEGEENVCLDVSEETDGFRFSVTVSDEGSVADSFEKLIRYGKDGDALLNTLPLLCILRVCMEKGIPWTVKQHNGKISFSLLLAKGEKKPVLFFSDATAAEVARFLQMVQSFFS